MGTDFMKRVSLIIAVQILSLVFSASVGAQSNTFSKIGGGSVDLAGEKGKVVVLAIGARWLPPTKSQASVLSRLASQYPSDKVSLFLVLTDLETDSSDVQLDAFLKANKVSVPTLRDPRGLIVNKLFKPDQMPAFVVIGKTGEMSGGPMTGFDPKIDMFESVSRRIEAELRR